MKWREQSGQRQRSKRTDVDRSCSGDGGSDTAMRKRENEEWHRERRDRIRMEVFGVGNYGYQKWYYLKVLSCSALSFYWR